MTGEVTGVKTIKLTFNKEVGTLADDAVKVVKGTVEKACKATVDGKVVTLAMDTKLTEGSYTITVKGVDKEDLTATVEVAKNEYLKTYEIAKELIPDSYAATSGYVYYKALNQYGEMMVADQPNPSTSFCSAPSVDKVATATEEGRIRLTSINTALAIYNQKGTMTLVSNEGVSSTGEVVYSQPATASTVEDCGFYKTTTSTFAQPTAKENAGNYYLLLKFKDQYDHVLDATKLAAQGVTIDIMGGITGMATSGTPIDYAVKGESYVAVKLASRTLASGVVTLNIVNPQKGLLLNKTIDITDNVIISSFTAVAEDGIFNGQENTLTYEAIDTNGNAVTDFAVLKNTVVLGSDIGLRWEKNKDNTAKLVAEPKLGSGAFSSGASTSYSHTVVAPVTFYLNEATSGNYKVLTKTYTVSENSKINGIYGLDSEVNTTVARGNTLKIPVSKIIYLDQYANKVSSGKAHKAMNVQTGAVNYPTTIDRAKSDVVTGCSIKVVTKAGMSFTMTGSGSSAKMEFTATQADSIATVYMKVAGLTKKAGDTSISANEDTYDYKFVVSATDTAESDAATLKIKSIFGGNQKKVTAGTAVAVTSGCVEVVAIVGGAETVIPQSQYTIKSVKNDKITAQEVADGITSKKTEIEVLVTTFDANNNESSTILKGEFTISTDAAKIYKFNDGDNAPATPVIVTMASCSSVNKSAFGSYFNFKDQYGETAIDATKTTASNITYTVQLTHLSSSTIADGYKIWLSESNDAYIDFSKPGDYTFKITATTANGDSKSVTVTYRAK